MKKITELTFKKQTTRQYRDENGKIAHKKVIANIKRKVKVVSGGKRFAHYFIDLIAFQLIFELFSQGFALINLPSDIGIGVIYIGFFSISTFFMIMYPLYYFVFEYFFQKTPGKFLTKTKVIDAYGKKPEIGTLIVRSLIRMVPFEPLSCLSDLGWHDRWSETWVVSDDEDKKLNELLTKQSEEN
jgi:uncharacterized RDD family membrane protein YckC|tara:strand:+ start:54 stop:608 length:555 start_codon:yes stop_codon:yes gene_type:complete